MKILQNKNILFSFIVPIYNAAGTLNRCLDSILARTVPDYEIILINDSSTDNSLEICEEYAAKYPQVSVYTYPNAGAGAARNRGLEKAKGEYILFCDSDDWYNSEELNKLLDSADEQMQDIDLLCFDYRRQWVDYFEDIKHFDNEAIELKNKEERLFAVSSSILSKKFGIILWNKIYKREIINKNMIRFPERDVLGNQNDWGEDLCFNILYVLNSKKICSLDAVLYNNYMRGSKNEHDAAYFHDDRAGFKKQIQQITSIMSFCASSKGYSDIFDQNDFYKIYIWQIYNYFSLLCLAVGTKEARIAIRELSSFDKIKPYIEAVLKMGKAYFAKRWNEAEAKRYSFFLEYILSGNEMLYKLKCKINKV